MNELKSGQTPVNWSPVSWQKKVALQQPSYPDADALARVLGELSQLPPLVTSFEVENLKSQLAEAANGERFLLQGGDCAENLADCTSPAVVNQLKLLLQMSLVLVQGGRKRVIRLGRFAGQYAKPRSGDTETRQGVSLPSYRGDLVNSPGFSAAERTPDPQRLLRAYERAALSLNFARGLIDGGFADLHHPEYWEMGFVDNSPHAAEYRRMVASIGESLRFMEALTSTRLGEMNRVDFFTSHEGLLLWYEQAQTRQVPRRSGWYNLSTHFPWIGNRTRAIDGAHVEYFRGIANPIGIKIDAGISNDELLGLMRVLDPHNEPGRLTLICRFGADKVESALPRLVEAVRGTSRKPVWVCDPMHGNTETTDTGIKTRRFDRILLELERSWRVHQACGSHLGGVHLELTGDNVTECIGGASGLRAEDLSRAYRSQVDPRLNGEQALEMSLLLSRLMAGGAVR
jgi:3-deoxy-7-phosphoheptulonate synthase